MLSGYISIVSIKSRLTKVPFPDYFCFERIDHSRRRDYVVLHHGLVVRRWSCGIFHKVDKGGDLSRDASEVDHTMGNQAVQDIAGKHYEPLSLEYERLLLMV